MKRFLIALLIGTNAYAQSYSWPPGGGGSGGGSITIGVANGLSLSGASSNVLNLGLSGVTSAGALSAADWNTFNSGAILAGTAVQRAGDTMTGSLRVPSETVAGTLTSATVKVIGLTGSRLVVTDGADNLISSSTTSTEVGFLSGVTAAIQGQINTNSIAITALQGATTTIEAQIAALQGVTGAYVLRAGDTMSGALNVGATVAANNFNVTPTSGSYQIGGSKMLATFTPTSSGANNTFVGISAGPNSTTGTDGTFVGNAAGNSNTSGTDNTYIGYKAGASNQSTGSNTFVGSMTAQIANNTLDSTCVGASSCLVMTSANRTTAVGFQAGSGVTSGGRNSFFGSTSGTLVTGVQNTVIGDTSGPTLTSGTNNALVGYSSDTGATTTYSSALGSNAVVTASSSVQLGIGTNSTSNSLQFRGVNFLNSAGSASFSSINDSGLTASRAVVTDGSDNLASSSVTSTELGFLSGATANIQPMITSLQGATSTIASQIVALQGVTGAYVLRAGDTMTGHLLMDEGATGNDSLFIQSNSSSAQISVGRTASAVGRAYLGAAGDRDSGNTYDQLQLSFKNGVRNIGFIGRLDDAGVATWYWGGASDTYIRKDSAAQLSSNSTLTLPTENVTGLLTSATVNITGIAANHAVATDGASQLVGATTTLTELNYLSGATSNIQAQIRAAGASFPLLAPSGSVAAPSYSFSANGGTGMSATASADGLNFSVLGQLIYAMNTANYVVFRPLQLLNPSATQVTTLLAANSGSPTFIFPNNTGSNGQVLTTDGAGTAQLSWTTPSDPAKVIQSASITSTCTLNAGSSGASVSGTSVTVGGCTVTFGVTPATRYICSATPEGTTGTTEAVSYPAANQVLLTAGALDSFSIICQGI